MLHLLVDSTILSFFIDALIFCCFWAENRIFFSIFALKFTYKYGQKEETSSFVRKNYHY